MAEEIKCPNILRFDKQQQKYVHCDHVFLVDGTSRGKVAECPKCGNEVRLGDIDLSRGDTLLLDDPGEVASNTSHDDFPDLSFPQPHHDALAPDAPSVPAQRFEPSDLSDFLAEEADQANSETESLSPLESADPLGGFPLDDLEADQPVLADTLPLQSDSENPLKLEDLGHDQASEVSGSLFEAAASPSPQPPTLPTSEHGTKLRMASYCPGCSAPLASEEILCNSCGYHKKLQRRIRIGPSGEEESKPGGFQRWLQNSLAEGTSVQGVLLLASALALGMLMLGAVVIFVAFGWWALIFLPPIVLVAALALSLVTSSDQTQESGVTGWAQRCLWVMLLYALRVTRWQLCAWPPGTAVVRRIHDTTFDDDSLTETAGLDECRVIDLERSNITDVGLGYLTAFPQLRFIVLRKTQVSDEAVRRLQRTIPAAWIWR